MKHILKSGEQFIVDGYTSEGEHKVLNLLDTNTDDIATMKVVSYAKLQYLKFLEQLSPGTFYRIIDYQCTTTQENTSVGPGQFDIIVQAVSESELSSKGFVARHEGDSYFSNCKVDAWEIKYSLENDTDKFKWADSSSIAFVEWDGDNGNQWYVRNPSQDQTRNGLNFIAWEQIGWDLHSLETNDDFTPVGKSFTGNRIWMTENYYQGLIPGGMGSVQLYNNWQTSSSYSKIVYIISKGSGVIYWMKDEYGNECPYDFKHIKFLDANYNKYAWTFNESYDSGSSDSLPTTEITNAKIWVDHFWQYDEDEDETNWTNDAYTQEEIAEDYTLNQRGKVYDYTGESITYNGTTLYIWRLSSTGTENELYDGAGYVFTEALDYSNVTIMDEIAVYAIGSSEDSNDIVYEFDPDILTCNQYIYHGTFSSGDEVSDLSSIVNDLSQVSATMMIDNFVDETGTWGESEDYPTEADLANVPNDYWDSFGDYYFTGNCVQYNGKILFVWYNDEIDSIIFTTGLDYSSYTAVDQICPIYAIANSEGAVLYDQDHDHNIAENLRSIIISATYSGPDIPKGNLLESTGIEQNLIGTIQENKIPPKFENGRLQVLDLTQIYYGPRKGYPYSQDEIDEAHKVIALALNEQKEILDKTIPFPEIIEVEHISNSVTQELDPWKYYIFGEVSSLEVSFSEEVSEYTPIYRFLFTAVSSSTQLILPQDCSLASGHSLVMAEGKSYEITVINNIVRVISATLE